MTRVRFLFLALRTTGYLSVLAALWWFEPQHIAWTWLLATGMVAWASWDQWKRPAESSAVMRRGVWVETFVVVALAALFRDALPVFLFVSPLARASIHLGGRSAVEVSLVALATFLGINTWHPSPLWLLVAQPVALLAATAYAGVLGELLRDRDGLRRLVALDAAHRERRNKDEERLRMAMLLHDTQGQAWTAVLRGIDAALLLDGEQQRLFLQRTRDAAQLGLQQMREATHDWYQGRLSPAGWMADARQALSRLESLTDVKIHLTLLDVPWHGVEQAPEVAELVARAMIETTTNAIRHGAAGDVWVQLTVDEHAVHLLVRDNGHGLKVEPSSGMGLSSLEKTANGLGGTLSVEGVPEHGVHVRMKVPTRQSRGLGQRGETP